MSTRRTTLESYLGVRLARIPVNPDAVGRWKTDNGPNYYDFFAPAMESYGRVRSRPSLLSFCCHQI